MNHDYDNDVMRGFYGEEADEYPDAFEQFIKDRTYYKYDISIEDIEKVRAEHRPPFSNLIPKYSEINRDYMNSAIDRIMKISQENEEIAMICDMAILYLNGVHPVGIHSTDMTSAVEQNELFMQGYLAGTRNGMEPGRRSIIADLFEHINARMNHLSGLKEEAIRTNNTYEVRYQSGALWELGNIRDYLYELDQREVLYRCAARNVESILK